MESETSGQKLPSKPKVNPWMISTFILLFALIIVGAYSLNLSRKQTSPQLPLQPTIQNQELSTPELIEQAFAKGEITAEQRLLYLAYAVGDYEKLPARYRGNVPWRSTLTRLELTEAVTSPSSMCSLSPYVQSEMRRLFTVSVTCNN